MNMKKLLVFPPILAILALFVFLLKKEEFLMEFPLLESEGYFFSFSLLIDPYSLIFLVTVISIFSSIFSYSFYYLQEEVFLKRFLALLSLFVLSMMILILSGNFFSSIIGWDGLGVTSVLLILFFHSPSSMKAGVLTFLMNRVGDCFIIVSLFFLTLISINVSLTSCNSPLILSILLFLTSITKSAQIPFSSWLPAAMEAPTPVSALVHSSTLVTAGIFILFRYPSLWVESESVKKCLCILSLGTLFLASLSGLVEVDLKKIIAYSTLSQLGFIMFCLSVNLLQMGFFHLIIHAFFKALLFMVAGYMIHSSSSWQDIRFLNAKDSPNIFFLLMFSLFSLCGFPFLSGFYSKDGIVDLFKSSNFSISIYVLLMTSLFLTVLYSFRLLFHLSKMELQWSSMSDDASGMFPPMMALLLPSCISGSVLMWLLFPVDLVIDNSKILLILLLSLMSIMVWVWKKMMLKHLFGTLFFLSVLNKIYSIFFFKFSKNYLICSEVSTFVGGINKSFIYYLFSEASKIHKSSKNFLGSVELLVFCLLMVLIIGN
nr:NADH dehydrogenase subunit 5 [Actornithophilus grandiceps]